LRRQLRRDHRVTVGRATTIAYAVAMLLRPATSADANLLAELTRHVHDLHVAAEPALYRDHDAAAIAGAFRERLAADDYHVVLAESAGRAAGCVCYRVHQSPGNAFCHPRSVLFVDQLVVVPDARRAGLGRRLMEAVDAEARRLGIDRIELDVRAFNRDALAFYTACGYAPASLRLARAV
jgi:GNAT superfamily N-acetyltransferase